MGQNNVTVQFEIVRNGESQGTQEFDLDTIKVGKLSSSHLRLDDPDIARIHAVIERNSEGAYTVMDLGSASGTLVNGDKVTKAELRDGDSVQFGNTVLHVRYLTAQAQAPVAPAGLDSFDEDFGEATQITASLSDRLAAAEAAESSASAGAGFAASAASAVPANHVRLSDGSIVECYTMVGEYDEHGNFHPAYYDEHGEYYAGYVYTDEYGERQVLQGYYDPQSEWVSTEDVFQGPSDTEVYTETFFSETGGDTLEVAFLWQDHVLSVSSYPKARSVLVGADEKNDFVIEDQAIPSEAYPLVSYSSDGSYSVTLTPQMQGLVQNGDERYTIQEVISAGLARGSSEVSGAYSLPIGVRTSVRIDIGDNTFLIRFSTLPALVGGSFSVDRDSVAYIAGSALVHVLLLMLVLTWPDSARGIDLDGFGANDRFVQMLIKPEQEEEEVKPDWLGDGGDEEEAAKHKGDEGQAGKEDSTETNNMLQIEGPRDNKEIELKRIRDTEVAMTAGALAVFSGDQVGSMWGSGDQSVGSDAIHALGNLTGDGVGEARGMGGLGLHGAGRGGGGVSERGIGMANVGTAGRGGGGRGGSGYGKNEANLGDRNTLQPKIVPGRPAITGSLDREIIQRVVRQHRREITYCYETELQKNRNLAGRVTVRFTISANGSVVSAMTSETSLNNAAVERCINDRIRRWMFPEPKGGGIVIVNYPFNFSS